MKTTTTTTTSRAVQWCHGCDQKIDPGTTYLEHQFDPAGTYARHWLAECLTCAARNGRPGYAEPDVPEQPLDLEGIA